MCDLVPQTVFLLFKKSIQTYNYQGEGTVLVAQLCPTLCDLMGCSLLGSSICGIFQARILEWVAITFSRGFS